MNLSTVEIPRANARQTAAEYLRAARHENDPTRRDELERMARAYRVAAQTNIGLISLTPTIEAGGTITRTRIDRWSGGLEHRRDFLLPRLAVCRWQTQFCYTLGIQHGGGITFSDALGRRPTYQSGVIHLDTQFQLPTGYHQGWPSVATCLSAWQAMVPIVPPKHRPARGLGDRLVLFEVADWQWASTPRPPGDPALLSHVAGDIYAVEAMWELTELEQLVLSERRPERV